MKPPFFLTPDDFEQATGLLQAFHNKDSDPGKDAMQVLLQKLARLMAEQTAEGQQDAPPLPQLASNLRLSVADGIVFIPLEEIRFVKADGPYAEVHYAQDKMILVSKTLKDICARISHQAFERVHQSYLCNLNWVEKVHRDGYLLLKTQEHIPVSRANWQRVMDALDAIKNA